MLVLSLNIILIGCVNDFIEMVNCYHYVRIPTRRRRICVRHCISKTCNETTSCIISYTQQIC